MCRGWHPRTTRITTSTGHLTGVWAETYNAVQRCIMTQKPLNTKELEALRHIRNRIAHGERPPSVRDLAELLGYSSPNAAAYVLMRLIEAGYVQRRNNGRLQILRDAVDGSSQAHTVNVPLVGSAPCGAPLLADGNVEAWVAVSDRLARPPHRYFLLRAIGTSMNTAGIQDGDLVLVRQQPTAENGDRVVALIDDEATIKVFRRAGDVVALEPRSSDKKHRAIILTSDFRVQGVVQSAIPSGKKGNSNG